MTLRDFLDLLGVRRAGKAGIPPVNSTAAISRLFDADCQRQEFDHLRKPAIDNNAKMLGKE